VSIQVSVASPELQRQMDLLKYFPEISKKHFRPAMEQAAPLLENAIRPNVPVVTGHLRDALGSKVLGTGLNIRARVGFGVKYTDKSAPYSAPVNAGARAHPIKPGTRKGWAKYLAIVSDKGFTLSREVQHPGFPGFKFMEKGLDAATPQIDTIMAAASEAVVQELSVP
jgi:hypothetical protein